ncbi:Uncharacterised protein [Mycobacteroides abscessus subsp. abscessus]|nr:Uncharacterised protein [Mycobacteroides abscessus subsp. abscessus]
MFSPMVRAPFTWPSGTSVGTSASYWAMRAFVRSSNAARSASVHQFCSRPSPSYCEPWSSKPCPISCPMTAPIAP